MYVIAYDIANPKRLRRVARVMERHARRVQKSVFVFEGDEKAMNELLEKTAERMVLGEDVVQAWKTGDGARGLYRGSLANVTPDAVVLERGRTWLVEVDERVEGEA